MARFGLGLRSVWFGLGGTASGVSITIGSVWARFGFGLARFGGSGFWREYHNWLDLGAVWVRFGREYVA